MRMPHIVEIVHIDENMTLCCLILFLALTKQKSWNGKGFFRFVQHTVEPVAIRLCHPPRPISPHISILWQTSGRFQSPDKKTSPIQEIPEYMIEAWPMAMKKTLLILLVSFTFWSDRSQGGFLLHMLSKSWKRGNYNVLAWNFEFTSSSFYLLVMENLRLFVNAKLSNKIAQRSKEKSRDRIMVMQTVYAPFLLSPWEKIWNSILYITDKDRSLGKITITSLITFSNPLYLSLLLSATFKKCLLLFTKWNFKYYCWEIRRNLFSFSRLLLRRRIFYSVLHVNCTLFLKTFCKNACFNILRI